MPFRRQLQTILQMSHTLLRSILITSLVLSTLLEPMEKVGISLSISQTPLEGGPFFYYLQDSCSGPNGIFNPYNGSFPTGNDSIPVSDVALGNFPNNGYVGNGFGEGLFGAGNPGWSLNPQNKAFIGNLTVVFQYANKTPIACTKLEQISTKPSKSGASKIAGAAAALPLAAGVAALLI